MPGGEFALILRHIAYGYDFVLPNAIERVVAGDPVSIEPLQFWADVGYCDGLDRECQLAAA